MNKNKNWHGYCFEPSPYPLFALYENLLLNEELRKRCKVFSMGMSDSTGVSEFFPSKELHNSGVGNLAKTHNVFNNGIFTNLYKLDDIISQNDFEIPDIIKIDVEGFELEVIKGGKELLEGKSDLAIIFEMEEYRLQNRNIDQKDIFKLLDRFGFIIYSLKENKKIISNKCEFGDLLALKGSFKNILISNS